MQKRIGVKLCKTERVYSYLSNINVKIGDFVVVETQVGEGLGQVIFVGSDEIRDAEGKRIIRIANVVDEKNHKKVIELSKKAIETTKKLVSKLNLDMNIVDAEYTLDLSKVTIEFISENRVDFRELIKELVVALKTRIELRQITAREQAQLVGGIGPCGRMCCCATFLKDFEKVSMKMAKVQGLALNPSKISGTCGRLMCCLEYENPYYLEVASKMPKINSEVTTSDGLGVVIYQDLLKQIVSVKFTLKDGSVNIKDFKLTDIKFENKNNILREDDEFNKNLENEKNNDDITHDLSNKNFNNMVENKFNKKIKNRVKDKNS